MNWSDISHVNPYLTTFNMNKPDWFQEKKTFYSFKNLLHLRKLARALFQSFNFFSLSIIKGVGGRESEVLIEIMLCILLCLIFCPGEVTA